MKTPIVMWTIGLWLGLLPLVHAENRYPWLNEYRLSDSIAARVKTPAGFVRVPAPDGSFADWLRHLPLKERGTLVRYWNGALKPNQDAHAAVVNLDLIGQDLQQCADAIIRLRAEYLWSVARTDEIQFRYSCSREPVPWQKWREGWRTQIYQRDGRDTFRWVKLFGHDGSRANFTDYLWHIMMYAGTASLSQEMQPIKVSEAQIGDTFVEGGAPGYGHGVLILDMAQDQTGRRVMLLGQSYMPAQDFCLLWNPQIGDSPWFDVDFGKTLETPEWTFTPAHARRFR